MQEREREQRASPGDIMSEHHMTVQASWHGSSQKGEGELSSEGLRSTFSTPRDLGGPGKGTSSEELVLGASAVCYLITLAVMLGKRSVPFDSLDITTDGTVLFDKGLQLVSVSHHPRITLPATATAAHRELALAAAEQAEQGCMVARAMRGNVAVSVHAVVAVAPAVDEGAGARALQA
jgi:peroxiredoxin-like protein